MNVYELVTEKILAALEAGTVPWHRPWDAAQGSPVSIGSNKAYRGINVFLLEATAAIEGYRSPYWGTYKAIQEQGGQVRKGEKSTLAVFWTRWTPKDREGTEQHDDNGRQAMVLRYYRVFNAEQADGLPARFLAAPSSPSDFDPIGECETIMAGYLAAHNAPSHHLRRLECLLLAECRSGESAGALVVRECGGVLLDGVSRADAFDRARERGWRVRTCSSFTGSAMPATRARSSSPRWALPCSVRWPASTRRRCRNRLPIWRAGSRSYAVTRG